MKKYYILVFLIFAVNISFSQQLTKLYKKVNSSIVVIKTEKKIQLNKGGENEIRTSGGQGSGVLISEEGLIWTASHVVHSAERLAVKFLDGDIYEAEVLSSNPLADVALIKIIGDFQLKNKHIAKIGNSDNVEIGEDIFVIGAPLGIEQTLSKGIISGRMSPEEYGENFIPVEYLQTDAAINPGNSGGPMFNMNGEVIAIASFILSESGGFDGIGFGATSNVAKKILMEQSNLWTGIEFVVLKDDMAKAFNLPQKAGLMVVSLTSKGLGNQLELQGGTIPAIIKGKELFIGGDILLSVAGIDLNSEEEMLMVRNKILKLPKGESYIVKYFRGGEIRIKAVIKK